MGNPTGRADEDGFVSASTASTLLGWEPIKPGGVRLAFSSSRVEVSISTDGSVRVRGGPDGELPVDLADALGRPAWEPAEAEPRARDEGGVLLAFTGRHGSAQVEIEERPFVIRIRDRAGTIVAELTKIAFSSSRSRIELASDPAEAIFGLGGQSARLDQRGEWPVLRNRDRAPGRGRGAAYASIPFVLTHHPEHRGHRSRGIFLDGTAPSSFDLAQSDPECIAIESHSRGFDLVVLPGPEPRDVLQRFTARVGRSALPPRWALGHHQSRWSYKSEQQVRRLARQMRKLAVPSDAIHLDKGHMDGYRSFHWNEKRFPRPESMLQELVAQGFRVVTIVDPGVKVDPEYATYREGVETDVFCKQRDGSRYSLRIWPGEAALPDFNRASVRAWWAEQHRSLLDAGVAGIWNDMNEPAGWKSDVRLARAIVRLRRQDTSELVQAGLAEGGDIVDHEQVRNAYGLQECRATRDALENGGRRGFVLTRSGCAGIQSHAAVWTGDNRSRWADLRDSLPMLTNLSLSGVAFCGADIGGFSGSTSAELYARWMQIGALYPFARTHSSWLGRRQEPWSFGRRTLAIVRSALELRMRLLPYMYGLFHQAAATGTPIWRPLFFEFPDDAFSCEVEDQVMVGPSLLVAPVLTRGARTRELYLPPGVWYDWQSDARYVGPRRLEVPAPLDRLPLFVRAGSVIPTQSPTLHVDETPDEPLVLEVFPGAEGESVLCEDDGATRGGPVARTRLRLRDRAGGRLRLELGRREGDYEIAQRPLRICVHACPTPDVVLADGERLAERETLPGYEVTEGRVDVRILDQGAARSVEIEPAP